MDVQLSVLMITYNHEAFIARSIESVLAQKINFAIELVIGDDCSTDATVAIAKSYADKHPGIIKLHSNEKNIGVVNNFQQTLSRCKGKYIAMLEGDDRWIAENKLQRQFDFLEQNPHYVLCGGHTVSESTQKTFIYHLIRRFKFSIVSSLKLQTFTFEEVVISNHFKTLTVVFRADKLKVPLHPAFNKSTILDWLVYISLGLNNSGTVLYANLPMIMAAYNVHAGGIFSGTSLQRRLQIFADVRNSINEATHNKFYGYHLPIYVLNDGGCKVKEKHRFIAMLNEHYHSRPSIIELGEDAPSNIDINFVKADLESLGYLFGWLYICTEKFDVFTKKLSVLMDRISAAPGDEEQKLHKLRALASAWRSCMFYERFSLRTVWYFRRSLLSKYADIYVYTLILTLMQQSKR